VIARLRILLARALGLFRRHRADRDLQQEIAAHLAEAEEDYRQRGLSAEDAHREARRLFGGVAQTAEAYRDGLSFRWWTDLQRDVRHGVRALARSAGFSTVVLLVLAIGIGAVTSVFALLYAIVLRPLPFQDADRLVAITHAAPGLHAGEVGLSSGLYFHYRERASSFDALGIYDDTSVLGLSLPDESRERVTVTYTSATLFRVLHVAPEVGRLFTDEDGAPGFMDGRWQIPVLLSHDLWARRFSSDPAIVGRLVTLGQLARRVVGVMPAGFAFPDAHTQIWMLQEPGPAATVDFGRSFRWHAVARLQRQATDASARAELTALLPQVEGRYRDATAARIAALQLAPIVTPLKDATIGDVSRVLWTLFGAMTLLLAIACANAATLFVVRAEHRRQEVAVRQALGASRGQIARLFFVEAILLTTTAAVLGVVLARGLVSVVLALTPVELPRWTEIHVGPASIVFAFGLAVAIASFYGLLSVRHQGRVADGLRRGGRWSANGGQHRRRVRDPFVAAQVALALVLIVGSALMVRTYHALSQRRLGFSAEHLLTVDIGLPYREAAQHVRIYHDLVERIRGLSGVERASAATFAPLTTPSDHWSLEGAGAPVPFKFFVPGYFQTMGTRIVEGEAFATDAAVSESHPVLVSAALARRLYPGQRAIGRAIQQITSEGQLVTSGRHMQGVPPMTIAGIVDDVRETTLRDEPAAMVYVPIIEPQVEETSVPTEMTVFVRTTGAPLASLDAVRAAIRSVDPNMDIGRVQDMDAIVAAARSRETFVGTLLVLAALVSIVLGVIGIYGSVAHVVRHRTREIGVRLALGATRVDVVRLVISGTVRAVAIGAAIGLAAAFTGTRALRSLLFGVEPTDPFTFAIVTMTLVAAALAAASLAARAATRVSPSIAMRNE
jgi:predicted permease